jgi:hypothetical protein
MCYNGHGGSGRAREIFSGETIEIARYETYPDNFGFGV